MVYSESEIIEGFREEDAYFFQRYFYEYCRVAYNIYDKKYGLSQKENLDFMSLAHQYALYLIEHNWHPLEDHSPEISLRTWMVNGFRYIVLDALKWYKKEYGSMSFEDYLCSFDTSKDLRLQFNQIINGVCDKCLSNEEAELIRLLLIEGYMAREIAEMKGVTPSAISQRYQRIREQILVPYLKQHFDMNLDMPEVITLEAQEMEESMVMGSYEHERMDSMPKLSASAYQEWDLFKRFNSIHIQKEETMETKKRTTPERITELQPGEIFVFGSNLRGSHGGGAAWTAYKKFGAIMGQGVGLQGQSYGIPTMQGGVETIKPYVDEFIEFAKAHPELTFLVTRIGCGIAGFYDHDIAPLFTQAHDVENIILPEGW